MTTKTILVLGAAGRLGRTVAMAFRDAGWIVRGLVRPGAQSRLPAGVEAVGADAGDRAAVVAAAAGVDVIFHGLNPAYTNWDSVLPTAETVIAAAKSSGATVVFPGNVYAFGAGMPAQLTPQTPEAPTTSKGRVRQALEARFRQACEQDGVRFIIVRAGDFFGGDGPGTWFDLVILKNIAKGSVSWPTDNLQRVHAWAFLPDLAQTVLRVAERRGSLPAWAVVHFEGHNVSGREFLDAINAAVVARGQQPLRHSTIPWWSYRLVSPLLPVVKAILEMRYLWEVPHALVDDALPGIIGAVPRTPLNEAALVVVDALIASSSAARRTR